MRMRTSGKLEPFSVNSVTLQCLCTRVNSYANLKTTKYAVYGVLTTELVAKTVAHN